MHLSLSAPGIAVYDDRRDDGLEGVQGRLGARRTDDLRRARQPEEDRTRQGRRDDQENFNGSPPLDRRDGGTSRASVPVRESARELGKRPGAIPGNGIAFPEDLRRMALVEACNGQMKASFFRGSRMARPRLWCLWGRSHTAGIWASSPAAGRGVGVRSCKPATTSMQPGKPVSPISSGT